MAAPGPDVLVAIEAMRRAGKTFKEIADYLGRDLGTLQQLASTHGLVYIAPRFWDNGRKARAIQMAKDGYSASQIAADLGCSRNAVIGCLHRADVHWKRLSRPDGWLPRKLRPRPPKGRQRVFNPGRERVEDTTARIIKAEEPPASGWIFFKNLEPESCRWPVAGEPGPMMRCCGAPRMDAEHSYCPYHYRRGTVASSRR